MLRSVRTTPQPACPILRLCNTQLHSCPAKMYHTHHPHCTRSLVFSTYHHNCTQSRYSTVVTAVCIVQALAYHATAHPCGSMRLAPCTQHIHTYVQTRTTANHYYFTALTSVCSSLDALVVTWGGRVPPRSIAQHPNLRNQSVHLL